MPIEIWTILALFLGPVIAVLLTLWYQSRNEKRSSKHRLFLALMANRKVLPVSRDWVDGLNMIDVVFEDSATILTLWHELYALLHTKSINFQALEHKKVQLLSAMAESLGYKTLQQVDIDKFYQPLSYEDQLLKNEKLYTELLRVLENTGNLLVKKRTKKNVAQTQRKTV